MAGDVRLRFLGTGASEGTPGEGRSRRRESSALLTAGGTTLLLDATRDLDEQLAAAGAAPDGLVLTHGHRDASAGVPALRRHVADSAALPVFASPQTLQVVRGRTNDLDHLDPRPLEPGDVGRCGSWTLTAVEVPHARRARFRTYAWRCSGDGRTVVYASDVGELTGELRELAAGADLLVLDGAMYRQSLFSHLRIEEALPVVCDWDVGRILLTQIGRTAPAHDELVAVCEELCARAAPAWDGMELTL